MFLARLGRFVPSWNNALAALLSAILLILAFPDFEYWFLAWFALVPLLWAIGREKDSSVRAFVLGWLFGTVFLFGTCWWLTYAPIHYAGFPWPLAYFLILIACLGAGIFPALFAAILSMLLRRFGSWALVAAPFVWVFSEFLRYWLTGNNWNAIAYSQAFNGPSGLSAVGGTAFVSFWIILLQSLLWLVVLRIFELRRMGAKFPFKWYLLFGELGLIGFLFSGNVREASSELDRQETVPRRTALMYVLALHAIGPVIGLMVFCSLLLPNQPPAKKAVTSIPNVIAVQPNVPMSGLDDDKRNVLLDRQVMFSESAIHRLGSRQNVGNRQPITVILPESPMNFMWDEDPEFQEFMRAFAARNNVSVLFNSAEPDPENKRYFNSAVLISPEGREVAQYDKIYLLPFGEAVPVPLESFVPAFVGNFSYGKDYKLVPLGDANAGIMICFESHFGQLSREYVRRGADVIIEMTNDGYLGPTPVLRQHLANAVFRAVETNRPVLRVTNVGITAYINERGQVLDPLPSYSEGTRVWSVAKSDGSQTFYVRYGDWFAWLCSVVTLLLLAAGWLRRGLRPSQTFGLVWRIGIGE